QINFSLPAKARIANIMADIKTAGSRFHNPHPRRRIHKRDLDGIDGRGQCHQHCQQDHVDDADWHDCDGDSHGCGINYH
ncbi:hypothetical protein ACVOAK_22620, partial [Shigella flexneri]